MTVPELMNHEEELVKAFIDPRRQERYLGFLRKPKLRHRFTCVLAHFKHLDARWVRAIPPSEQNSARIAEILKGMGAPDSCWVISEAGQLDAREMRLTEALSKIVGNEIGTFLSCLPGKLAYFEDEDTRCILQRL